MSTRILVAMSDRDFQKLYDETAQRKLAEIGEVVHADVTDGTATVPEHVGSDFDVLITSWSTQTFDPKILDGSRLRLAVHSAGSVRKLFPVDALKTLRLAQGGADAMAVAVAEMAITLTLAQLRNLPRHDRRLQATHDWQEGGFGVLGESIAAQRIGIVSLSRVGQHYARMARGLGASDIAAYDPYASPEAAQAAGVQLVSLDELFERSDVLSIHTPATPETKGLLTAQHFARLRDNAIIVNTARAEVLDESALLAEVVSERLRVALDVFTTEPLPADSDFYGRENVLITPHVAGGTVQARFAQGAHVVEEIEAFLHAGTLRSEVTVDNYDRLG